MEIHTELSNKEIEDALVGDIGLQWETISSLEGDTKFYEELEKIKFGVNTQFDIRSIIEGEFEKKTPFGEVWIERKLKIPIDRFRDEIDERKKLMRNILRKLYNDEFDSQTEEDIDGYEGQ